ncbi:hypothetical protein NDU88_001739 [Pleurodeles waltl]|uniref:Uncharacterized protein n=1 Tax=Pleurodeles waltl TaxID=8319 RepID=A0AAV7TJL9_PLEWA|nr:hypothetical protein NDU88_001739 [Pleurodeles waltl]
MLCQGRPGPIPHEKFCQARPNQGAPSRSRAVIAVALTTGPAPPLCRQAINAPEAPSSAPCLDPQALSRAAWLHVRLGTPPPALPSTICHRKSRHAPVEVP